MKSLREILATLAHDQWAGWMKHLFSKGKINSDGTWLMPKWAVDRWKHQMNLKYRDLTEQERDSDRREADRVLEAIGNLRAMSKFESKEELAKFIHGHTPIAIKPVGKSKYLLKNPFSSANGRKQVLEHIIEKLWIKLNEDG